MYSDKRKSVRADVSGSLAWESSFNDNICRAVFKVVLQNTGNSTFEISKVHLQAWLFDKTHDTSKKITFLDIDKIQSSGEKIFDKVYETEKDDKGNEKLIPFVNRYPPESII
ncbi:MAG: hypothetical protein IPL53_09165 [Ignavibacteria bacterium]|nr:hypothetical protein [Ignavibacteria bacterium]